MKHIAINKYPGVQGMIQSIIQKGWNLGYYLAQNNRELGDYMDSCITP
jgi:hypothetical protein